MLLVLIAALFFPDKHAAVDSNAIDAVQHSWIDWGRSLGISLIAVSFTYGGYQQAINFGTEVQQPSRTIPRGIFIAMLVIITLYLLVNLSYYNVIGFAQMKNEREIAYSVIDKIFGSTGANLFSVFLFIGVLSYVNGSLLSNPRVMFAMGEDKSLPGIFAQQSAKTNVLVFSLTVFTAISMVILFFSQEFDKILSFTIFLDCFGMILSAATIFWFRKKAGNTTGKEVYQMKWFPLMPVIFIAAYLFVGSSIVMDDPKAALIGIGLLAGFVVLYFLLHGSKRKPANG